MRRTLQQVFVKLLAALLLSVAQIWAAPSPSLRQQFNADSNWKFFLGDPSGAEAPSYADSSWRSLDLPHDWSIESRPEKDNPSGSGGWLLFKWNRLVSKNFPRACRLEREAGERRIRRSL
jgi:hypothetical protein